MLNKLALYYKKPNKYSYISLLIVIYFIITLANISFADPLEYQTDEKITDESQQIDVVISTSSNQDAVISKVQLDESVTSGDVLLEGMLAQPSNLLPYLASDSASSSVSNYLFGGLLKFDRDLNTVPDMAESFEVLDDGLRIIIRIRKDVVWSDGAPFTADDVEFTYKTMINPETPTAYAGDYLQIKEFNKLDKYTVEIVYDKPFPRSLMTWMGGILPKHLLENEDLRTTKYARAPIGNGHFILKDWQPGVQIKLLRNDTYFDGIPLIEGIIIRFISDLSSMFLELRAGNLDISTLTPLQYVYQSDNPKIKDNYNIYRNLANGYTYLGYNLKHPLFKDVKTRQALAYGIDKESIVRVALFGQGYPAIGPYKPETWPYNDKIKDREYNPALALKMLGELGWVMGDDGVLQKDGRRFSFTIIVNQGNMERIKTATLLLGQLKEIGVEVKIRVLEWTVFLSEFVNKGAFDAVILAWNITLDPDIYDVWHSSKAQPRDLNFVGFQNKEADKWLEMGRSTFDKAIRKEAYDNLQLVLHEEQPYCFLYIPYQITAVHKRFNEVDDAPLGIGYNINFWWVKMEQQLYRNYLQP